MTYSIEEDDAGETSYLVTLKTMDYSKNEVHQDRLRFNCLDFEVAGDFVCMPIDCDLKELPEP